MDNWESLTQVRPNLAPNRDVGDLGMTLDATFMVDENHTGDVCKAIRGAEKKKTCSVRINLKYRRFFVGKC